jgi:hypothetical protein
MLRLVKEDKTPMDINQALDFFERNALAINKRWQQLRKNNGIGSSMYQDYLVPRFAFPKPKIELRAFKNYMPWASIISNYRFDGLDAIHRDGQVAFRTSNNLKTHS